MRATVALFTLAAAGAFAGAATAEPDAAARTVEDVSDTASTAPLRDRVTLVVAPVPQSSPALGNGLAVAALAIYQPEGSGGPWSTGLGGLYTDTDSWAAGIFQKAHFADDRFRATVAAGYADLNLDFYGVGTGAGDRDRSVEINQTGTYVQAEGLARVRQDLYLGLRYRFLDVDTKAALPTPPPFPDLVLPPIERASRISGLGPALEYDSRDSEYGPTRGLYVTGQWLWNDESIGSDFDYDRLNLAVNGYHGAGEAVIAWRGALCHTGSGAPFYDLCKFGQTNDLRGYEAGRYRDHATWAVQAEYRRPLFWRFGAVVFAGVGGVAPGFDQLDDGATLPAAGVGLRFAASRKYRLNISVDAAWGENSSAVYVYIGEAF